jgi:uncharacterized protein (TIGR02466 family)
MTATIDLFPIKIYKTRYSETAYLKDNLFSKLEDIFERTKDDNVESMQDGTLCTYFTSSNMQTYPETSDLVEFVELHARSYWKELRYSDSLEPKVIQIWANATPKNGWIRSHQHGAVAITAVLYVNAGPGMGNLVLENPLDSLLTSQPMDYKAQEMLHQEIEVSSGDLIMFPGWLRHHVKPNTTNEERLILGINFGSKGNYVAGQWGIKA